MTPLRMILGLSVLCVTLNFAQADVKYQYTALPASIKLKEGQKAKVQVFLEETISGKSNTFIGLPNPKKPAAKIGLMGAGFKISREGVVDDGGARITAVTDQTGLGGAFSGGLGMPGLPGPAISFEGTETINLTAAQGAQPIVVNPKTRRVLLAVVEITGGKMDSTFIVTNRNRSNSNTMTFTDLTGGVQPQNRIGLDDNSPKTPGVPEFIGARDQNFEVRIFAVK